MMYECRSGDEYIEKLDGQSKLAGPVQRGDRVFKNMYNYLDTIENNSQLKLHGVLAVCPDKSLEEAQKNNITDDLETKLLPYLRDRDRFQKAPETRYSMTLYLMVLLGAFSANIKLQRASKLASLSHEMRTQCRAGQDWIYFLCYGCL